MSNLAKSLANTKLSPSNLNSNSTLAEEEQHFRDDLSASSVSSAGTVRPIVAQKLFSSAPSSSNSWNGCFTDELYLETDLPHGKSAKFHVYTAGHVTSDSILVVCHHGAGSSGLSFAMFARELRRLLPKVSVMSIEARAHGSVVRDSSGALDVDFTISELSQDLLKMITLTADHFKLKDLPQLVFVGHSLGGAVVTDLAGSDLLKHKLLGSTVIDVVEGSALEALKVMQTYLRKRPDSFSSVENAIDWHVRTRTLRNPDSAALSVPSLLEEASGKWIWRTNLATTEVYWEGWFTGMSKKFLASKGAKMLLLAGTDRLDKELMIGQMQGIQLCPRKEK